jgi:sphinganine-1-phosphate aldolase
MGKVASLMEKRGWLAGQVRRPPSLHLMLSLHHAEAREAYVANVAACVEAVRAGAEKVEATRASYA